MLSASSVTASEQMVMLNCQARWSVSPLGEERNFSKEGRSETSLSWDWPPSPPVSRYWLKKTADIELVERIGFRLLGKFLGFGFQEGFVAVVVALGGFFAELFENGIGDHLLVDHLAELEAVQREDTHHLDEAGRQNLLLRHSKVELESLPGHDRSDYPFKLSRFTV